MNRAHFLQVRSGGFGYAFWSHATESKANPGPPEPTMRQERIIQASIFDVFAPHEIGRELRAISQWLDRHRQLLSVVAADLRRDGLKPTGRHGIPAEAVLRCGLLKQYRQLSYEELAFHVHDSASFRAFAGSRSVGVRRSRCCTRRSAPCAPRPGSRSIVCCWPAPKKRGSRAERWCGSQARTARRCWQK